ncbi:usg protein [Bosea sp. (in: a-proteobacteria)]|uniref:usg protein n=1 Tax=Bosea sp. (in: a-proteobacteria) TaxID=1871050 RepID=UPI002733D8DD|nr:usg protein [Bosea sp. (in: a-proteobacteria)]MDP3256118.1 usg protein [Bosea sp. (in: a-proteobacteria)]
MASSDFARQIAGYGLTTAGILYRMPDHPAILQEYVWQDYDLAPRFPELNRFLEFWQAKLEGKLFRVTVSHKNLIGPADLRTVGREFRLQ